MNKTEYLNKLKAYLHSLPLDELEDIVSDYEEHFQIGLSKGKTEEEISKELGDPYDICSNYTSINRNTTTTSNDNGNNLLIILLLALFNLFIVLAPYLSIVSIIISIYIASISFIFGGIAMIFGMSFNIIMPVTQPHILTSLGFGIGLSCLGLLTIILAVYFTKWFIKLTIRYIKWNLEIINRGGF